jgi:ribosomal protein S18 acetylase RimI-like enzyme
MPDNTVVNIRPMQLNDVAYSLLLSEAEGWNQTEKDWNRLASDPQNICLVAENRNSIIGTATAMNYANDIAWIGMVLVARDYRGRGISKILLSHLLSHLGSCRSVKLDATPAGQPVYEKFGFTGEYLIYRMTNLCLENFQPEKADNLALPVQLSDIPEITALDHKLFGAERLSLIASLIRDSPEKAWSMKQNGRITGFALGRQGRKYHQIGPVFAPSFNDARELISTALSGLHQQAVVIDVLSDKEELIRWLNSLGFSSQRHFIRMYLRTNPLPGIPGSQFLICGPEFG